eukprot:scaffold15324_cov112-Isochrysis_galbana.AAC.1
MVMVMVACRFVNGQHLVCRATMPMPMGRGRFRWCESARPRASAGRVKGEGPHTRAPSRRKKQQKNSTNHLRPNTLAETFLNYYTPPIGTAPRLNSARSTPPPKY